MDVHVKRLRESMGAASTMIETVRGAGYRITALNESAASRGYYRGWCNNCCQLLRLGATVC